MEYEHVLALIVRLKPLTDREDQEDDGVRRLHSSEGVHGVVCLFPFLVPNLCRNEMSASEMHNAKFCESAKLSETSPLERLAILRWHPSAYLANLGNGLAGSTIFK